MRRIPARRRTLRVVPRLLARAILTLSPVLAGCSGSAGAGGAEGSAAASTSEAEPAQSGRLARGSASASPSTADVDRSPPSDRAWVIFGADTVVAEVARTPDERAEGPMSREAVPDGTGMLFIFDDSRVRSFWMKNTFVDLDIAYIDPSYVIVDIKQMEAESEEAVEGAAPAMFALEVRQGWFAEHGIEIGDTAKIAFGR